MAVEYFGQQTDDTDDTFNVQFAWYWGKSFVCPGSGSVLINELSAYVKLISGSPHIRLGIYDTSGNRLAQGTAEVSVVGASYSWQGHMTAADCGNVYLTGGQSYKLALACDAIQAGIRYQSGGSSGDVRYNGVDYTGGLPATIGATDSPWTGWWLMRCGVETGGGSAAVTGTATATITEADVVYGNKQIVITLTGDTWIAS